MHQLLTLQSFQTAELLCGTFRECKMLCTPIFQSQSTTEGTQAAKEKELQVHYTEHSLAVGFKRWSRQNHAYVGLKSQQQITGETKEAKPKHGTKADNSCFWTARSSLNQNYRGGNKLFEIYQLPLSLNQGLDLTVLSARLYRCTKVHWPP